MELEHGSPLPFRRPRVVPSVRQRVPTSVPEHARVSLEGQLGRPAHPGQALAFIKADLNLAPYIGGALASLVGDYVPEPTQAATQRTLIEGDGSERVPFLPRVG